MNKKTYFQKLEELTNRFYVIFNASPVSDAYVDVYDFDKFGMTIEKTGRRYKAVTFKKAISKAYDKEFNVCKNDTSDQMKIKITQDPMKASV
jgi:hypothetical protein